LFKKAKEDPEDENVAEVEKKEKDDKTSHQEEHKIEVHSVDAKDELISSFKKEVAEKVAAK